MTFVFGSVPDMEPIALSITADAAPAVHAVKEDVIAGDEETMLPSVPHSKVADTPCNGGVICSSPDAASPLAPVGACSEVFETPYTREVTARGDQPLMSSFAAGGFSGHLCPALDEVLVAKILPVRILLIAVELKRHGCALQDRKVDRVPQDRHDRCVFVLAAWSERM